MLRKGRQGFQEQAGRHGTRARRVLRDSGRAKIEGRLTWPRFSCVDIYITNSRLTRGHSYTWVLGRYADLVDATEDTVAVSGVVPASPGDEGAAFDYRDGDYTTT